MTSLTSFSSSVYHTRPLLILDLDETLIYSSIVPLEGGDLCLVLDSPSNANKKYYVYKRPNLDGFLSLAFEYFDVGVWTAASNTYANAIVGVVFEKYIDKLKFVYSYERCTIIISTHQGQKIIKDLKKIKRRYFDGKKYHASKILVVDDNSSTYSRNKDNAIPISSWTGDMTDLSLVCTAAILVRMTSTFLDRDWRQISKI